MLDNSVSIHHRNLQCLITELYKIFNSSFPDTMEDVFPVNTSFVYHIMNRQEFHARPAKSVYKVTKSFL